MKINCLLDRNELLELYFYNRHLLTKKLCEERQGTYTYEQASEDINVLINGILFTFYSNRSVSNLKKEIGGQSIYKNMSSKELLCLNNALEDLLETDDLYNQITYFYDDNYYAFRNKGNGMGEYFKKMFYGMSGKVPINIFRKSAKLGTPEDTKEIKQMDVDDTLFNEVIDKINLRLDQSLIIDENLDYSFQYTTEELMTFYKSYLKILSNKLIPLFNRDSVSGEVLGSMYLGFFEDSTPNIIKNINNNKNKEDKKVNSLVESSDDLLLTYYIIILSIIRDLVDKKINEKGIQDFSEYDKFSILVKAQQIGAIAKEHFKLRFNDLISPIFHVINTNYHNRAVARVKKGTIS